MTLLCESECPALRPEPGPCGVLINPTYYKPQPLCCGHDTHHCCGKDSSGVLTITPCTSRAGTCTCCAHSLQDGMCACAPGCLVPTIAPCISDATKPNCNVFDACTSQHFRSRCGVHKHWCDACRQYPALCAGLLSVDKVCRCVLLCAAPYPG
jgi:hypothetical protein